MATQPKDRVRPTLAIAEAATSLTSSGGRCDDGCYRVVQRAQFTGEGLVGAGEEGQDPAGSSDSFSRVLQCLRIWSWCRFRGRRCWAGEGGDVGSDLFDQVFEVGQAGLGLAELALGCAAADLTAERLGTSGSDGSGI